jgi:4-amino-4-deoxy-L-arabinose transferase-like glycosyltransferase
MVGLSADFGATWDERVQQKYGEDIWNYYAGALPLESFDNRAAHQTNIFLYSGLVEVICVGAQRVLGGETYRIRHAVVAVFGWIAIIFSARLAARVGGTRAGWLAGLLLVLSPRFIGHAMNNSKDLPFAALIVVSLFCLSKVIATPPFLSWQRMAALTVAIGLAINVRPVGFILIPFAFAAVAIQAVSFARSHDAPLRPYLTRVCLAFLLMACLLVPAASSAWPWAQAEPFVRPLKGFFMASGTPWATGFSVLYRGRNLTAGSLPWDYVPTWLLISTPPIVLIGLAASVLAWKQRSARPGLSMLLAFPTLIVTGVLVRHTNLYDGIRQLLFIVPPIIILSALGWEALLRQPGRLRWTVPVLLLTVATEPVVFQVRNHPHQAAYFTPLIGGPRAAFGRYDMDYWGASMLEATRWAAEQAQRMNSEISITGNPLGILEADAASFPLLRVVPRDSSEASLDIRLLRGPRQSVLEFASRPDVVYRVTLSDGTPLCVVLARPATHLESNSSS